MIENEESNVEKFDSENGMGVLEGFGGIPLHTLSPSSIANLT